MIPNKELIDIARTHIERVIKDTRKDLADYKRIKLDWHENPEHVRAELTRAATASLELYERLKADLDSENYESDSLRMLFGVLKPSTKLKLTNTDAARTFERALVSPYKTEVSHSAIVNRETIQRVMAAKPLVLSFAYAPKKREAGTKPLLLKGRVISAYVDGDDYTLELTRFSFSDKEQKTFLDIVLPTDEAAIDCLKLIALWNDNLNRTGRNRFEIPFREWMKEVGATNINAAWQKAKRIRIAMHQQSLTYYEKIGARFPKKIPDNITKNLVYEVGVENGMMILEASPLLAAIYTGNKIVEVTRKNIQIEHQFTYAWLFLRKLVDYHDGMQKEKEKNPHKRCNPNKIAVTKLLEAAPKFPTKEEIAATGGRHYFDRIIMVFVKNMNAIDGIKWKLAGYKSGEIPKSLDEFYAAYIQFEIL